MLGQNGSSRLDTVLKMLLIAFVSLLAFSSGVYFGKEMSDSEYQLKSLEKDFNDNEQVADLDEADVQQDDAMIDEEIADLSEKYMNNETAERTVASADHGDKAAHQAAAHHEEATHHAAAHEDVAPAKTAEKAAHQAKPAAPAQKAQDSHGKAPAAVKPAAVKQETAKVSAHSDETAPIRKGAQAKNEDTEVKKVAERVAKNEAPTEKAKEVKVENRKPASLPKVAAASASAAYTVQVASYPTEQDAKKHAEELVGKGFPAYPLEASIKGKTWYRVSVGSFKTSKEASAYRAQFLKQSGAASALVQKIDR